MDLGLKKKKVILAGATAGMGKATALIFAQEGCDVAPRISGCKKKQKTKESLESIY